MGKFLLHIFFFILYANLSYSQKDFENTRAYYIYKGLHLTDEDKIIFKESMDLEKDVFTWQNQRSTIRAKIKEVSATLQNPNISENEKRLKTEKLKELNDELNNKSYDINEYYEIINETRKKMYLKSLNSKKLKELSSNDYKFVKKLMDDAESFFGKAENIRKRAYKEADFQMSCLTLNNATDFEVMGIKILEKAVMFAYKIEPEQ